MTVRVLIADDDALLRDCVRALFAGTELEAVAEARNGREAEQLAGETQCDIVLLDFQMPGSDGFEVLRKIRSARPDLPVLMYSGVRSEQLVAIGRQNGASGWVVKGDPSVDLLASIRGAVSQARGSSNTRLDGRQSGGNPATDPVL